MKKRRPITPENILLFLERHLSPFSVFLLKTCLPLILVSLLLTLSHILEWAPYSHAVLEDRALSMMKIILFSLCMLLSIAVLGELQLQDMRFDTKS